MGSVSTEQESLYLSLALSICCLALLLRSHLKLFIRHGLLSGASEISSDIPPAFSCIPCFSAFSERKKKSRSETEHPKEKQKLKKQGLFFFTDFIFFLF
jgi:hypothetical protein